MLHVLLPLFFITSYGMLSTWERRNSYFQLYSSSTGQYSASYNAVPFFPTNLEELADDASFSIKVGLISKFSRIRVDLRTRMTSRERDIYRWLLLTAKRLLDKEYTNVRIFLNDECVESCNNILQMILSESDNITSIYTAPCGLRNCSIPSVDIKVSSLHDSMLGNDDKLIIVFKPDNIEGEQDDVFDNFQALCFHCALRNLPMIVINPQLVAPAWTSYGPSSPLLLGDFAQVYYICDDYFTVTRQGQWYGVVQRAASGFDLFVLSGLSKGTLAAPAAPSKYECVGNWPQGVPYDIKAVLSRRIFTDTKLPYVKSVTSSWRMGSSTSTSPPEDE